MSISTEFYAATTLAPSCAVAAVLIWAAISDVRYYLIPNTVSIIVAVGFVVTAVAMPRNALLADVAVAAAATIIGLVLFFTGRMGGGDVKLFASLSLWAGPVLIMPFTLVTCAAAFVVSLVMLSPLRALMPAAPSSAVALTGSDKGARRPMPFGVAIVAGGFYLVARRLADGH